MTKEKLVEVKAKKTFQCMKDGKSHTVIAGKTDRIPESEASAAEEAGLLSDPSASNEKPQSGASNQQEIIDDLEGELDQVTTKLKESQSEVKSISLERDTVQSELQSTTSELDQVKDDLEKSRAEVKGLATESDGVKSELDQVKSSLEKATAEIKKLKTAAKKPADKA